MDSTASGRRTFPLLGILSKLGQCIVTRRTYKGRLIIPLCENGAGVARGLLFQPAGAGARML